MVNGLTVDANVINLVRKEVAASVADDPGELEAMLECLLTSLGIVVTDFIHTEWEQTCRSTWFSKWYDENVVARRIRPVEPINDPELRKVLRLKGLPSAGRDHHYILCAKEYAPHYLLTEDIDFFDPRSKKASVHEKKRVMEDREGQLCRFLERDQRITVGMLQHCRSDLNLEN